MADINDQAALRAENARLIALLEKNHIEWQLPSQTSANGLPAEQVRLSTEEKVTLIALSGSIPRRLRRSIVG